jgi:hypothetical protein
MKKSPVQSRKDDSYMTSKTFRRLGEDLAIDFISATTYRQRILDQTVAGVIRAKVLQLVCVDEAHAQVLQAQGYPS